MQRLVLVGRNAWVFPRRACSRPAPAARRAGGRPRRERRRSRRRDRALSATAPRPARPCRRAARRPAPARGARSARSASAACNASRSGGAPRSAADRARPARSASPWARRGRRLARRLGVCAAFAPGHVSSSLVGAPSRPHHRNPAEAEWRWRRTWSRSGSAGTTHAPFARNVERNVSNSLAHLPTAGSLLDQTANGRAGTILVSPGALINQQFAAVRIQSTSVEGFELRRKNLHILSRALIEAFRTVP